MLDNTALGQRLIFDSFGVVPKTTWQIVRRRRRAATPPFAGRRAH